MKSANCAIATLIPPDSPTVTTLEDDALREERRELMHLRKLVRIQQEENEELQMKIQHQELSPPIRRKIPMHIITNTEGQDDNEVIAPDDERTQDVKLKRAKWKIIQQETTILNLQNEIWALTKHEKRDSLKKKNSIIRELEDELEETTAQLIETEDSNEQMKVQIQRLEKLVASWNKPREQEHLHSQRALSTISQECQNVLEATKMSLMDLLEEQLIVTDLERSPQNLPSEMILEAQLQAAKYELDGTKQQVYQLERLLDELSGSKIVDKIQKLTQQMKETKQENLILHQTIEMLEQERDCLLLL